MRCVMVSTSPYSASYARITTVFEPDLALISLRRSTVQFLQIRIRIHLDLPDTFEYWDVSGNSRRVALHPGTLAFTFCQVPIIAHRDGPQQIVVTLSDGSEQLISGCNLDSAISQSIFQRTGVIQRLEVFFDCPHNKSVQ